MAETIITREMIEAAAAAIANNRAARGHGAPAISNVLAILPQKLKDQVLEDAEDALKAALSLKGTQSATTVPVPAPGTEERDFWLEAAEQRGVKSVEASDFIQQTSHHYYVAGEQAVLDLMAAAREQGRKDMLTASFQARVRPLMMACFGEMIAGDREERNHRFLEEALELVQACGCTADEAHQLVDYAFGRPVGEKGQEVGGVMVTLAALCLAQELDLHREAEIELARIWAKVEQIRAKQAAKPKYSALPEQVAPAAIAPGGDR